MASDLVSTQVTMRLTLRGLVQGQGVRPMIARLATKHGIAGTVQNSFRGVEIAATGEFLSLHHFRDDIISKFDDARLVTEVETSVDEPSSRDFHILESIPGSAVKTTIPLDLVVCHDCLQEVRLKSNRRFRYPFTTCTRCGPRYSILHRMPFDRNATSMAAFPMCDECTAEYCDPHDRRFHAQTIACEACGPSCWAADANGATIAEQANAISFIAKQITAGRIAAVKGIGGYQLMCDATNDDAVRRLRSRKHRPGKPLPVMVANVAEAEQLGVVNLAERTALLSSAGPIVLLRSLQNNGLAPEVAPQLRTIGVMLATSPLHAMLLDWTGRPLIVTSGNVHGAPLIYQNEIASVELGEIADVFLHHDREIIHPVDDSVVQCFDNHVATIRAARGIAPLTVSKQDAGDGIATGGYQKVATAIANKRDLVLTPHIGDMVSEASRIRFQESIERLCSLYQVEPRAIACDRHPGYFTTAWANEQEKPAIAIGHHHAHVAAAMLEHELVDQSVFGIAFDGTGFGDDGTIWGGEAILATSCDYQRVGHLRCFRLPGGENAIKQPQRIASSLLAQLNHAPSIEPLLQLAIDRGPSTSSMGRLFDGVAALTLRIETIQYEGEAAMRLEACCDLDEPASYQFTIIEGAPLQFDWRPVIASIRSDTSHLAAGRIAMKFHRAVAALVIDLATRFDAVPCVITGGVFQNRVLVELIRSMALNRSLDIRVPGKIPVNDGGLGIGQWVVASARQH